MKVNLINQNFKENYIKNLLEVKGINNLEQYLDPPNCVLQNPSDLDNIEEGYLLLEQTLKNNKEILLVVDSDCDGFTSSAIIYLYIKQWFPESKITYILHEGKQHGLQDHIDNITEKEQYGLIILPDSSSNDEQYHDILGQLNIPVLVLDHHILETEISKNAIIINNQSSENYLNKSLTGAGVVWQFCRYIDKKINKNFSDQLIDLAALGIIGDMGNITNLENRYIIKNGLNNINNFFFSSLIDSQSFSMNNRINPTTVAFYIVPMINAMIRIGSIEEKTRLFEAFIDGKKKVKSNKRGAKGEETLLALESIRECTNAKSRQNKIKDKVVENLEIKIFKYGLLDNKILFIRLDDDDDFPSELNGLVANQLANKYNHPTIVARLNDEGYIRGSARGLNNSGLKNFKDFVTNSNLIDYALGHENAYGFSILNKNLSEFHKYANEKLQNLDFSENVYNVNFIRMAADNDLINLITDISKYIDIWGQGLDEPLIYISDINITQNDIEIIGKNKDTVKFSKFGITYIKFHAKELINELQQYNELKINVVGKANINEWMGRETPQIMIEGYEILDGGLSF